MNRIRVELWAWPENKFDKDFKLISNTKYLAEIYVEDGTTIAEAFRNLADQHAPIREKIFNKDSNFFYPNIVVTLNNRVLTSSEIYGKVLQDEDSIAIVPFYIGG